jgi:sucrose phosphorylase
LNALEHRLLDQLTLLYGAKTAGSVWKSLREKAERFTAAHPELHVPANARRLTQADRMLITYGDMVQELGRLPLGSLAEFLAEQIGGLVPSVHILPFYPYSSDDGFSVIDYLRVEERLGDWDDIQRLRRQFRLMFDAVINHISSQSAWFQQYLAGIPPYTGYFLEVSPTTDLSQVFRPRTHPLLTRVQVGGKKRHVWTTFSADQVDLNFANPQVLLEIMDVLLFYATKGARFIRLDATGYLWKEIGTRCLSLPQAHAVVKLIHALFDWVAPGTMLITETNVPHEENISYFGDGNDEAHLVYNFALPPLVLHSFMRGNAQKLSSWAAGLKLPSCQVTFFNFLASHDGIGVTPARGILEEGEITELVEQVRLHGGLVSARVLPDGSQVPYELNISYFDALSDPKSVEPIERQISRFIAAHAIMFSIAGMPGIYFHSLFGSRSWREGVELTGQNRTINRQKLNRQDLESELANPRSLRGGVFSQMKALLRARAAHPAFSPYAPQEVLGLHPAVFCLLRGEAGQRVICLHNVSGETQQVTLLLADLGAKKVKDLLSGERQAGERLPLMLPAYAVKWLGLDER